MSSEKKRIHEDGVHPGRDVGLLLRVLLPPTPCLGGFVGCHLKRKESMRMVCILGVMLVCFSM